MEPNVETFSTKLISLTMAANKDFIQVKELQAFLDKNAELLDQTHHTIVHTVTRSLVNHVARVPRDDLRGYGNAEVLHREYKNVLESLMSDDPSPMVKLLAHRAALCWLRVQLAEREHTELHQSSGSVRYSDLEWVDKQLTVAHNRFLRACDALTRTKAMEEAIEAMKAKRGKGGESKEPKQKLALVSGQ